MLTQAIHHGEAPANVPPRDDTLPARPARWGYFMAAAQDGHRSAYKALLKEVTPWMEGHLHALELDDEERADLSRRVLLALHAKRHTYRREKCFVAWLKSVHGYQSSLYMKDRTKGVVQ